MKFQRKLKRYNKALVLLVIVMSISAISLSPASVNADIPAVIKIGTVLPLTGALGWLGPDMVRGAQIAAYEINENGGIMGSPIELIVGDSGTDPLAAVEAARNLVDIENVQAIIGAAGSSNTLAVAESVTIDANVVLISPASTAPEIADVDDDNTLWRTAGPDRFQGMALADLADYMGYETAGIMTLDNAYGIGLADAFEDAWDGDVLTRIEYDPNVLAWQSELSAIDALNPDFLWLCCYAVDGAEVMRELNELGITLPVMSADGLGDMNVVVSDEVAGRLSQPPTIGTKPFTPESPGGVHFAKLWEESHASEAAITEWGLDIVEGAGVGDPQGIYAAESYDALNLVAMAIAFSGDYSGEAIKTWLPYVSTIYKPATGDKTFDEFGDVAQDYAVYMFSGTSMVTADLETIGTWNAITRLSITKDPSGGMVTTTPPSTVTATATVTVTRTTTAPSAGELSGIVPLLLLVSISVPVIFVARLKKRLQK